MNPLNPESINYLIVHHSGTSPSLVTRLDSPDLMRLRHKHLRGFEDIGYHYVIGGNGLFTKDGGFIKAGLSSLRVPMLWAMMAVLWASA